ncbi:PREDICTED: peroxisomal membrane protein 11A [Nanorana parkeri]|uniref:peroxisomal membrane protein 11A n=1 Tax=Nanorana parkeri TaxID=125878 RepID=UPI00085427F5|nr:PREDICTED: peroxisomal membrane protein 11A [Nanorana parkeri]XP_018427274.1 PREDICTED: peroxisomal membrane protein 11A [Nanorana parkeri]
MCLTQIATMDGFIKFMNQSQGRDRLFRATQYACMLLSYMLENKAGREKVIMKLKRVESNMSSGRKLFRLGNFIHAIEASKAAIQLSDSALCYCLTAANLNRVLYFTCDSVLWAISVGLVSDINKITWRLRATRCYFYSLLFHLARDVYIIRRCMKEEVKGSKHNGKDSGCDKEPDHNHSNSILKILENIVTIFYLSLRHNPPVLLDTIKNVCDLLSPLDRLGVYQTSQGFVGICGLVSSIIGIVTVAQPVLKLKS